MPDLFVRSDAVLSPCGLYRYSLARTWGDGRPKTFVMLNPSTADAAKDDPTIRRCMAFARALGYGGIVVVNLFALRATDPKELYAAADPVGPENDTHIREHCAARIVIAAWGAHGGFRGRGDAVLKLLSESAAAVDCLGTTKQGQPRHPLYVKGDTKPAPLYGPRRL